MVNGIKDKYAFPWTTFALDSDEQRACRMDNVNMYNGQLGIKRKNAQPHSSILKVTKIEPFRHEKSVDTENAYLKKKKIGTTREIIDERNKTTSTEARS